MKAICLIFLLLPSVLFSESVFFDGTYHVRTGDYHFIDSFSKNGKFISTIEWKESETVESHGTYQFDGKIMILFISEIYYFNEGVLIQKVEYEGEIIEEIEIEVLLLSETEFSYVDYGEILHLKKYSKN